MECWKGRSKLSIHDASPHRAREKAPSHDAVSDHTYPQFARKITLTLDAAARDWLAAKGWDPAYGARPLKRVIQRNLQDPLAEMILAGEITDGDRVVISAKGNVLTFNGKAAQTAEIAQFEAPVPKRKLN